MDEGEMLSSMTEMQRKCSALMRRGNITVAFGDYALRRGRVDGVFLCEPAFFNWRGVVSCASTLSRSDCKQVLEENVCSSGTWAKAASQDKE